MSMGFAVVGSVALALFLGGCSPVQSASDLAWIVAMGGFGGPAVLLLIVSFNLDAARAYSSMSDTSYMSAFD